MRNVQLLTNFLQFSQVIYKEWLLADQSAKIAAYKAGHIGGDKMRYAIDDKKNPSRFDGFNVVFFKKTQPMQ